MVTLIREDLNLLPFEYAFAKKTVSLGIIIQPEILTVFSVVNCFIWVNLYDIQMIISDIDKALTMNSDDKEWQCCRDTDFV